MGAKQSGTILDAAVAVLKAERKPLNSTEIHKLIVEKNLFQFGAKDPVSMVRAALRKHLRGHGGAGQPAARLLQVEKDRFEAV